MRVCVRVYICLYPVYNMIRPVGGCTVFPRPFMQNEVYKWMYTIRLCIHISLYLGTQDKSAAIVPLTTSLIRIYKASLHTLLLYTPLNT